MKSRVMREYQARCCERLVVQFHRPTRQLPGATRQLTLYGRFWVTPEAHYANRMIRLLGKRSTVT
jgi:hypothetical protein